MLELALLLSFVALALAVLSTLGFFALLVAGVGVMLAWVFVDWLRHRTRPARVWARSRFGERLRPLVEARATLLLSASLCGFLGWLVYLWYASPPGG